MPVTTSTAFTKWFWTMLLALGGGASVPLGVPPLPEDPVLTRIAPEECLAYFASAGTAAADPKSPNQTEQLLAEPEIQSLAAEVERLVRSGLVQATKRQGAEEQALAEDGITLLKALLVRPMAVYVSQVKLDRGSRLIGPFVDKETLTRLILRNDGKPVPGRSSDDRTPLVEQMSEIGRTCV